MSLKVTEIVSRKIYYVELWGHVSFAELADHHRQIASYQPDDTHCVIFTFADNCQMPGAGGGNSSDYFDNIVFKYDQCILANVSNAVWAVSSSTAGSFTQICNALHRANTLDDAIKMAENLIK